MLSVLRHSFTPRIAATLALEIVVLCGLLCFLSPLTVGSLAGLGVSTEFAMAFFVSLGLVTTAIAQFSMWSFGLYSREIVYGSGRLVERLTLSSVFSAALLAPIFGVMWCVQDALFVAPVRVFAVAYLGFLAFLWASRLVTRQVASEKREYLGNVLILGTGPATTAVARECEARHRELVRLGGILTVESDEVGAKVHGCPVLGPVSDIRDWVEKLDASVIVVALPRHSDQLPAEFLVRCKLAGKRVFYVGEFYETIARKVLLENFSLLDFLYRQNLVMTRFRWLTKSTFEKGMALLLLLPAAPIMLLAALLVRLTSKGPILYRQTRCGQHGETFEVLKFRSMVVDAERHGAVWAQKNDPRVTTWGRIMRKTRIDELPQIFNILRGDMSFVGPRPERPEFVAQLAEQIPHYEQRHLVKPGLTGWAQVAFRYGSTIEDTEEKLRYDLYYVKNLGLLFDLVIILSTVRTVLWNGGAH